MENRYIAQRDDAAQRLWIHIDAIKPEVVIHIWDFSWEWLTLAKAIQDIDPRFTIVWYDIATRASQILDNNGVLRQAWASTHPTYSLQENIFDSDTLHGNYGNFKWVSGNKRLTSMILKNAWIYTPRELALYMSDFFWKDIWNLRDYVGLDMSEQRIVAWNRAREVKDFCKSLGADARIVIKPINWCWWKDVFIWSYWDITADLMMRDEYSIVSDIVVQEKIESYPLYDERNQRLDWNLRVLTTVDENWDVIVVWITGRIDRDGWPINRSISADNISLYDLSKKIWWSDEIYSKLKKDIEETAIRSVQALIWKISPRHSLSSQDLAWVDIIVDKDMRPCVIELNDSDSWCIYELMCLEGIQSIYPIAEAIVRKAKVWFTTIELCELFKEEFWESTPKLVQLILNKDIITEDCTGWITFIATTKLWEDFLLYMDIYKGVKL